ncbi:MAG: hypothetical protein WBX49_10875 [Candidatus Deferrimicrobiaceae bacterium]
MKDGRGQAYERLACRARGIRRFHPCGSNDKMARKMMEYKNTDYGKMEHGMCVFG